MSNSSSFKNFSGLISGTCSFALCAFKSENVLRTSDSAASAAACSASSGAAFSNSRKLVELEAGLAAAVADVIGRPSPPSCENGTRRADSCAGGPCSSRLSWCADNLSQCFTSWRYSCSRSKCIVSVVCSHDVVAWSCSVSKGKKWMSFTSSALGISWFLFHPRNPGPTYVSLRPKYRSRGVWSGKLLGSSAYVVLERGLSTVTAFAFPVEGVRADVGWRAWKRSAAGAARSSCLARSRGPPRKSLREAGASIFPGVTDRSEGGTAGTKVRTSVQS
mmetsp:Transcript_18071/g.45269  ORF Transcript_18071/g.45269 Transcript_18071/m.45269 type:complete len:276 (+) Transcript_18071:3021-3848(+)